MNKSIYLTFAALCITNNLVPFGRKTLVVPRSPSTNAALELAGWQREIHQYDAGSHYWSLAFTPEYTRSFRRTELINYLFDGKCSFEVSGSRVADRGPQDLLADYFGLPADYRSTISFCPTISNAIFDFDFYLGIDCLLEGFYLRIHAPIVHGKWDLNFCESIHNDGVDFHPAGYMSNQRVTRSELGRSVHLSLQGIKVEITEEDEDLEIDPTIRTPLVYGDVNEPIRYGMVFGRQVMTRLADLQFIVGWDFLQDCWYHFGLNARFALPTGNRPCARYLFEPIVGNGGRTELGIGLSSHVDLWECDCKKWALYVDANLMHLFGSSQCRSFELKDNGPGSRYMILQQMTDEVSNLLVDGTAPNMQYGGVLYPAINQTTFKTNVSVPWEFDGVIKFAYYYKGLDVDFGYNLWARSAEKLQCRGKLAHNLAVKGDAQLYGFTASDEPVALSTTQHEATLKGGQGVGNFVAGQEFANDNADNAAVATTGLGGALFQLNTQDSADLGIAQLAVNSSNPAIILTDDDIDNCSALSPKAVTHKLFGSISHRWATECVTPFLGVGAEVEFGPVRCIRQSTRCNGNTSGCTKSCDVFAVSQWGVWVKGGLTY